MSVYLGDFVEDAVVRFPFTTNAADGGRESFSASLEEADIVVFKDGAAMTLDASTITITTDIGSRTGVHMVAVDMSNDADFTTGADYAAVLYASDETLDSQAPAGVLACWSCENRTVDVGRVSGSSTAADNAEVVFDTDFATNYNATRNAWATNVQDTVGTGNLPADVIAVSGDTTAADNAELFFDGTGYNAANSTIGTCTTNTDMRGTDSASTHSAADVWTNGTRTLTANTNLNDPTAAAIADAVWDEAVSGHTANGTYGKAFSGATDVYLVGMAGTINTLDALDTAQDTQHSTTQGKVDTAQSDLDILTGTDGVTLATTQPNYAPATATALSTAQADLDTITGSDGVTLATTQGNYAPAKAGDNMGTVSAVTGGINTAAGTITTLDGLDTAQDTQHSTTQARLPAALVGGRIDATVDGTGMESGAVDAILDRVATGSTTDSTLGAIINDWENGGRLDLLIDAVKTVTDALTSAAAAKLASSAGTIVTGTVSTAATTPSTTVFAADDITEATADHYNGRIVIFTSGALSGQATDITDYALDTGEGKLTVTAMTEAPANNDTFVIV